MTERAVPDPGRRYEAYSHQAMHTEVAAGNDPAAAGEISEEWSGLGARLRESAEALGKLSENSEEHWQGTAGEAVRGLLSKAAAWSGHATEVSFSLADSVTQQAGVAARAKAEMPEPVDYDPAEMIRAAAGSGDLLSLVGLSFAMSERKAEAEAARAKAIDVMNARDAALRAAVPAQSFESPPALGPS